MLYIIKRILSSLQVSFYDRTYGWDKLHFFQFIRHLLLLPYKGYKFTDRIYDFIPSVLKKFSRNVVCSWNLTALMGLRNHAMLGNVRSLGLKTIQPNVLYLLDASARRIHVMHVRLFCPHTVGSSANV